MGLLTDLWNQIAEFFQIEVAEPIVPESKDPPKPLEPKEHVTTLPEKPVAEIEVEPIEPLPPVEIIEPVPIGEQGKADRIKVLPAKEEPFTEPPSVEDYPASINFFAKDEDGIIAGANVTFLGQTKTTDKNGQCSIGGRMKIMKNYPITASKAGYKTTTDEISFAFAPRSGFLGGTKILYMERL